MTDFKEGDRVRVKNWDDMVQEFELDVDNDISILDKYIFNHEMEIYCGNLATFIGQEFIFDEKDEGRDEWWWIKEMFVLNKEI